MIPKTVAVVGSGVIGSHLLEHLARMQEVGKITIIDRDEYSPDNLRSQRISVGDVGQNKAGVWVGQLGKLRPVLRVTPIRADVRDVPLGVLHSDLILSCVDSRLARQWINQKAHRLSIPWIDAGVDAGATLARINTYLPSADSPCMECPWDERDYAALEVEYSCQKQNRQTPTNASSALGALAASLQAIEVQKAFQHPEEVIWGRQVLIDARTHHHYVGRFVRNPLCRFDHRVWAPIQKLPCGANDLTIAKAFQMGRNDRRDSGELSLSVDTQTFAQKLACIECGLEVPLGPLPRLRASLADERCGSCDKPLHAPGNSLLSSIELKRLDGKFFGCSLADLGLRPADVYTITGSHTERHFQIPS